MSGQEVALAVSVFLACAVEAVEALDDRPRRRHHAQLAIGADRIRRPPSLALAVHDRDPGAQG